MLNLGDSIHPTRKVVPLQTISSKGTGNEACTRSAPIPSRRVVAIESKQINPLNPPHQTKPGMRIHRINPTGCAATYANPPSLQSELGGIKLDQMEGHPYAHRERETA